MDDPNWVNYSYTDTLEKTGQPVKDLAQGGVNLAWARLAHGFRQQDIEQESANARKVQAAAFKNRMKEIEAQENFRVQELAAAEGLLNPDGTPITTVAQYAPAKRNRLQDSAVATSDFLTAQMDALNQKQASAVDNITRIASKPLTGGKDPADAAARREALKSALESPASKVLPDDIKRQLWNVALSDNLDPAKMIAETVQKMQSSYFGNKGITEGIYETTRYNNAAGFLQAYLEPLRAQLSATQQNQLASAASVLQATNQEIERTSVEAQKHMAGAAAFLPGDYKKKLNGVFGPSKNPLNAISDLVKPGIGAESDFGGEMGGDAKPVPEAPPAPPVTANPPRIPREPRMMPGVQPGWRPGPVIGGPGVSVPPVAWAPQSEADRWSNWGDVVTMLNQFGQRPDWPPSAAEVLAHHAATVPRMDVPGVDLGKMVVDRVRANLAVDPAPKVLSATPLEVQKVHDLAKQFFSDADRARSEAQLAAGNPQAISAFNTLLKLVRAQSSPIPVMRLPQTAPISAPPPPYTNAVAN